MRSKARINDGRWHHVIAEADRASGRLTLYINGREDRRGSAIEQGIPLSNQADLFVGGTLSGDYLKGALDFLRIGLGTLADSRTDIDELVAWQFRGPFLKDFAGNEPAGKRDAGALEKR